MKVMHLITYQTAESLEHEGMPVAVAKTHDEACDFADELEKKGTYPPNTLYVNQVDFI
jgi:hypothetical protein